MEASSGTTYSWLREASPSKRQELAAVMACDGEEHRYEEFVAWLAEDFATLDHRNRAYVVAEAEGVIVGFARLWNSPHIREWVIDGLVVSPSHRRKGVGRSLLSRALNLAGASGASSVIVQVSRDNTPAIALYEKAGFRRERAEYLNSYGRPRQGCGWQWRVKLPLGDVAL